MHYLQCIYLYIKLLEQYKHEKQKRYNTINQQNKIYKQ